MDWKEQQTKDYLGRFVKYKDHTWQVIDAIQAEGILIITDGRENKRVLIGEIQTKENL